VTDPSDVRDAAGFVQALRALKVWAGNPSFNDLERRSGLPRSTLADALNPRRRQLPRLDVVRAFVTACGVSDTAPWDEAWRRAHLDSSPLAVVPRELPPDVVGFTGRSADLAALDEAHPVIVVCGTAGVGKTALAVHWAHRHVDRFPDGQLYVNLRGYDAGPAVTVADAAGLLLHSLLPAGVPIPPDEHARVSLLRSLAVDRRLLIVLDNASSAAQVRPLLVAGADCKVIVTSRDALPGLVARDGARRVSLDVLSPAESVTLLASFVDSPSSGPGLAELARRCAYLPLGLRVAGELVADGSLAPSFDDLDAGGDEETSLRTVFSWSYKRLPADAARAFRLLGAHPGREYDVYAVAALMDAPLPAARALVRVLRRAHLLEERSPDRYTMHDLLHAYAVSLAAADSLAGAARARLVDYYIWGATTGHRRLHAYDVRPLADIPAHPPFPVPDLAMPDAAQTWLDTERANLIAAVGSDEVVPGQVINLANALDRYLNRGAHYPENLAVMDAALAAARHIDDRAAEARALCSLGRIYGQTSRQTGAIDCLSKALSIAAGIADQGIIEPTLNVLGCVYHDRGDYDQAIEYFERAIVSSKDPWTEATALGNVGMSYDTTGRYQEALDMYERSLTKHREVGNRRGEGRIYESIGSAHLRHGRHRESIDYLTRSRDIATEIRDTANYPPIMNSLGNAFLATQRISEAAGQHESALLLARQIGDRLETVRALDGLGDVAFAQGDRAEARARWDEAYDLALEIGVSLANDVRHKLDGLDTPGPSAG
jgi:tetratricopeptide (TPR) repeat protein